MHSHSGILVVLFYSGILAADMSIEKDSLHLGTEWMTSRLSVKEENTINQLLLNGEEPNDSNE
jgi:hypothetical protein